MKIICRFCGQLLAVKHADILTVKGLDVPLQALTGVILRCACGRLKTYHVGELVPVPDQENVPLITDHA